MRQFELEELIPLVAELTEQYTSKASTSVSYETANQLMGAVLYCIAECGSGNLPASVAEMSPREAYRIGYDNLLEKVRRTQNKYSQMIVDFCAYGNENYNDTVTKAIPGFFIYYDAKFAPQRTIITLDYPTICPITEECGIDAIEKFIDCILCEQKFLHMLPEDYVCQVLYRFQANYKEQFYNICSVILRHVLGCMLCGKKLGIPGTKGDYDRLAAIVKPCGKEQLQKRLSGLLKTLMEEKFQGSREMLAYLNCEIGEFTTRLLLCAEQGQMRRVVCL